MMKLIPSLAAGAILAACSATPPATVYVPVPMVRHHDEDRPINLQRCRPPCYGNDAAQAHRDAYWVSIQQRLQAKGYYRGQVDGVDGPATHAAVRRYQHDLGVPVTGRIGNREWSGLGLSGGKVSDAAPPPQGRHLGWVPGP